jgi:hypothetical protein
MKLSMTNANTKLLTIIATEANLVTIYSKKSLVVFATIFHQERPTVTNNPELLITK